MADTSNYNHTRCPKCFQLLTTWLHHDPIITPKGYKYKFNDAGLLISLNPADYTYKGFLRINADIIKELQDNRNQIEIALGLTPTVFTPVESTPAGFYIPNIKHIQELRTSTENILTVTGTDKETYFNYNDDLVECQSPHQLDWIDPILNNKKYLLKDVHIEDLRKFIATYWIEPFNGVSPLVSNSGSCFVSGETYSNPISDFVPCPSQNFITIFGNQTRQYNFSSSGNESAWVDILWGKATANAIVSSVFEDDGSLNSYKWHTSISGSVTGLSYDANVQAAAGYYISPVSNLNLYKLITAKTTLTIDNVISILINPCSAPFYNYGGAIITINFYPGGGLVYYCGTPPSNVPSTWIILSPIEFQNFHRNIYDDMVSKWGFGGGIITGIQMQTGFSLWAHGLESGNANIDWTIDNIKFK